MESLARKLTAPAATGPAPDGDLRGAGLSEQDLRGVDLSGRDLSRADLRGADLREADLSGANLSFALLQEASLAGARLDQARLTHADLSHANLSLVSAVQAHLGAAILEGATLSGADLTGASLTSARLAKADLTAITLTGARMQGADLSGAGLGRATLDRADLSLCTVTNADFSQASLQNASVRALVGFREATWIGVDIRSVNWTGAFMLQRHIKDENYLFEMRQQGPLSTIMYWIWWATSDCGRSLGRWLAWSVAITLVFAAVYCQQEMNWGRHTSPFTPMYFSIVTMTSLGYGDIVPVSTWARITASIQALLGYAALGGLLSIASNKMARRAD